MPRTKTIGKNNKPPNAAKVTTKNSHSSPNALALAERRQQALELRKQAYTYHQIGAQMGVNPSTAHDYVVSAMHEIIAEPAKAVLEMELARLDECQKAVYPAAVNGDIPSIDACLRILDRRAKLLGLYPDPKTALQVSTGSRVNGDGSVDIGSTVTVEFVVPGHKLNGHDGNGHDGNGHDG